MARGWRFDLPETVEQAKNAWLIEIRTAEEGGRFFRKRAGRTELLVPAVRSQREFPNPTAMVRQLRGAGLNRTEGGERPKLTIKAPSAVCGTGRVYCVVIGIAPA